MKKSLVLVSLAALTYVAYEQGLFEKLRSRIQSRKARQKQAIEEPGERRQRPRLLQDKKPSHWTPDGLLDLNSAGQEELENLRGLGAEFAERIFENRPYLSKIDLVGRMVIPAGVYETIKHDITVRHAA